MKHRQVAVPTTIARLPNRAQCVLMTTVAVLRVPYALRTMTARVTCVLRAPATTTATHGPHVLLTNLAPVGHPMMVATMPDPAGLPAMTVVAMCVLRAPVMILRPRAVAVTMAVAAVFRQVAAVGATAAGAIAAAVAEVAAATVAAVARPVVAVAEGNNTPDLI